MELAKIEVRGTCAKVIYSRDIPKGIVGATITIKYLDPMWDNLVKTVVFRGCVTRDVIDDGEVVTIPHEVVERSSTPLIVGISGADADNNLVIPTFWADLGIVQDAADPSGDPSADPSLPIWAVLRAELDRLKNSGATDEQIAAAVAAYLEENPVGTGTVRTVNDTEPDENGNVSINIPTDYVKTVNGTAPDKNGNVDITIPDSGGNAEDGFSPIATVEQTDTGAVISITDKDGTTTATITNGKDGKDGADGQDGYTPQKGIDYFDGQPGKDGADGAPGEKGDKGDKGDPGEPGQKGDKGDPGEKGEQGIQGIQGIPGEKGEKGDTGSPATLVTKSVTYQVSDSGIIIPSGSWGSSIPVVSQGKYLWAKTELQFNSGAPIVSYSVARMGIDGSGSVSSVAGVSPDATGNVQLTPDDIGADTKKKYGKLVVFGDSLGQGVNNDNYSFVDILSESGAFDSVVKACVSGATIGPYQTYTSAINYDLNSQVERYISDVRDADIIICEYCGNDLSSMMSGNTQMGTSSDSASATTICGYTKKALNRIYELNPDVVIQWVHFGETNYDVIKQSGGFMWEAGGGTADPWLLFAAEALRVVKSYGCKLLKINFWSHDGHVSNDGVHPNAAGQQYIANAIMNNLFCDMDIGHIKRPLTITGNILSNTNLAIDGNFDMILALLASGVDVPLSDGAMQFNLVIHGPNIIGFNLITDAGLLVNVAWFHDGNLVANSVNLT